MIDLITADAVKWANEYEGPLFHALLSDPPYHLTTIVKRFGKKDSAPAKPYKDGVFARASKGFMGQTWDGGDVAFRPETWAAFMKVLYPGAFGMAYAASRGWHRLACAIEDAGFIIHPTMFGWAYGSGFPKATRIDTQIDKLMGKLDEREIVGRESDGSGRRNRRNKETGYRPDVYSSGDMISYPVTAPATDVAKAWAGHRYGLQALKPALEPIIVFQKPYEGRPIDNMMETGAGALNIDGARIPADEPYVINTWDDNAHPFGNGAGNEYTGRMENGRWPANFVLLDEGAANALDEQAQASRFFFRVQEQLDEADPIYYCSKVSNQERDAGLEKHNPHATLKPLELNRYLATLLLPPEMYAPRRIFVPFAGVASECIGAYQALWEEIVGVELSGDYCEIGIARCAYYMSKGVQKRML